MQPKLSRKSQLSIKISRRLKMGLLVQKFADRMGEKRGAGHDDKHFHYGRIDLKGALSPLGSH
jgi:hypothetical protein